MSEQQIVEFVDLLDHPDYEILTVFPFTIRRKSNHYEVIEGFDKDGYLRLNLNDSFGNKTYKKHILIAKQFIPNDDPEHKNQVDHRNRIRDDNHLENLRWCTSSENCFNSSSKNGVNYEFVKELPEDAMVVETYNNHSFENYYYHDDVFYFWTGLEYRILVACRRKTGSAFVNMRDTNGKKVYVYYAKFKKLYDLI